jgi:hypothetical protein
VTLSDLGDFFSRFLYGLRFFTSLFLTGDSPPEPPDDSLSDDDEED